MQDTIITTCTIKSKRKGRPKTCVDHLGNEFPSVIEMTRFYGISKSLYYFRRKVKGMSLEEALTTEYKPRKSRTSTTSVGKKEVYVKNRHRGESNGNKGTPVTIHGVTYRSIRSALHNLRIPLSSFYKYKTQYPGISSIEFIDIMLKKGRTVEGDLAITLDADGNIACSDNEVRILIDSKARTFAKRHNISYKEALKILSREYVVKVYASSYSRLVRNNDSDDCTARSLNKKVVIGPGLLEFPTKEEACRYYNVSSHRVDGLRARHGISIYKALEFCISHPESGKHNYTVLVDPLGNKFTSWQEVGNYYQLNRQTLRKQVNTGVNIYTALGITVPKVEKLPTLPVQSTLDPADFLRDLCSLLDNETSLK